MLPTQSKPSHLQARALGSTIVQAYVRYLSYPLGLQVADIGDAGIDHVCNEQPRLRTRTTNRWRATRGDGQGRPEVTLEAGWGGGNLAGLRLLCWKNNSSLKVTNRNRSARRGCSVHSPTRTNASSSQREKTWPKYGREHGQANQPHLSAKQQESRYASSYLGSTSRGLSQRHKNERVKNVSTNAS